MRMSKKKKKKKKKVGRVGEDVRRNRREIIKHRGARYSAFRDAVNFPVTVHSHFGNLRTSFVFLCLPAHKNG
jgi:hypothetical protein